ncbi:MAG: R2-like ligand-binding oxidase [Sulfolobaceae archaeon]
MDKPKYSHEYFKSVKKGIEWEILPMKLYSLGKKLFWDPANIDFSKDVEDWKKLKPADKDRVLGVTALFTAGEEAVARDILPMAHAMERLGKIEEVIYLNQFALEEAKHVEAFRRFLDAIGVTEVESYTIENEPYRKLFYEVLPEDMWRLYYDPSPENIVKAATTYNMVVEGIAAEVGYFVWKVFCERFGILPGMLKMIRHIATDESRHIAFGVYVISLMISEYGEEMYNVFINHYQKVAPLALGLVSWVPNRQWKEEDRGFIDEYLNKQGVEVIEYARKMYETRMNIIQRARNLRPDQVKRLSLKELNVVE